MEKSATATHLAAAVAQTQLVCLECIMEARLPLAGEKAIRYRPAIVSL
jgi:hypothetical protein